MPKAGCIISCDGDVLVVHQHESSKWGFPKGRLEGTESPRECAVREVREETSISLPPTKLNKCIVCDDTTLYMVEVQSKPQVRIDERECDMYMWLKPDRLKRLETSQLTRRVLGVLLKN